MAYDKNTHSEIVTSRILVTRAYVVLQAYNDHSNPYRAGTLV